MADKVMNGIVLQVLGGVLRLENGHIVAKNLNYNSNIGDTIQYVEMRSLKTLRYGSRHTQWTESKPIGAKFFKQV